jgi:hypothetical protein
MAAASLLRSLTSARVFATRALARREVQSLSLGNGTPNAIGTSVAPRGEITGPDAAWTPRQVSVFQSSCGVDGAFLHTLLPGSERAVGTVTT